MELPARIWGVIKDVCFNKASIPWVKQAPSITNSVGHYNLSESTLRDDRSADRINVMKKVYISATYNDLKDHREAVAHALRKMGYEFAAWRTTLQRMNAPTPDAQWTLRSAISNLFRRVCSRSSAEGGVNSFRT